MIKALTLLAFTAALFAQNPPQAITPTTATPSGACTGNQGRLVGPGGTIYTCQNGTWAQASGSGGLPSGTGPVCVTSGVGSVASGSTGQFVALVGASNCAGTQDLADDTVTHNVSFYNNNLYWNAPFTELVQTTPGGSAPFHFYVQTSTFSGVVDDVVGYSYNIGGGITPNPAQPQWSEQSEMDYQSTCNCLEKHWNFTSIDRSFSSRPFDWQINLTTYNAELQYNLGGFFILADKNGVSKFSADTATGNIHAVGNAQVDGALTAGLTTINANGSMSGVTGFSMNTNADMHLSSLSLTGSAPGGFSWILNNDSSSTNYAVAVNGNLTPGFGTYALTQSSTGDTQIGAVTGRSLTLSIANGNYFRLTAAGGYQMRNGNVTLDSGFDVIDPNQKSTTGQRFVCVDTNGKLVSSASACIGT